MNSLAKLAIGAHGGLDRWKQFETVSAHLMQGGVLWQIKGQAGTLANTNVLVGLRSEWASHWPFGTTSRRSIFDPGRVALVAANGTVLEELREPRKSFAGAWRSNFPDTSPPTAPGKLFTSINSDS
jgi:hypothetical protein